MDDAVGLVDGQHFADRVAVLAEPEQTAATAWPSRMRGESGARRTGVDGRSGKLTRKPSTAAQDSATTMHAARMVRE